MIQTKGVRQMAGNKQEKIYVTSIEERIIHWLLAGGCLFALFTGLGLMFHSFDFIPALMGGHYAMKWMHIFSGVIFASALIAASIMWWEHCKFVPDDLKWVKQAGGYLWEARDLPPGGMYNAGQKMFFWTVFIFGIIIILSGLVMFDPLLFPVFVSQIAYMLHALSVMVIASFFVIHLYLGTFGNPGTVRIMFHGYATREYCEFHKGKWLADKEAKKGE